MSTSTTVTPVVLEPAAQEFAAATAHPPYLFDLRPVEGRKAVDQTHARARGRSRAQRRSHPEPAES